MSKKAGRYSYLLRPLTTCIDLIAINVLAQVWFSTISEGHYLFHIVLSIGWIIAAVLSDYYEVYRHTKLVSMAEKVCKQFFFQFILVASYNGVFDRFAEVNDLMGYCISIFAVICTVKFTIFFLLKYIRKFLGGNFRNIVLLGSEKEICDLKKVLLKRKDLGYRIVNHFFTLEDASLEDLKQYLSQHQVDEIFMQFSFTKEKNFLAILEFADNNMITVSYIPTQKDILNHNLSLEYYDLIPVVPRRVIPLDKPYNQLVKRLFDLVFSTLVIVFILSWLVPLVAFLIKRESKGPVFFKQKRTGLNDEEFWCYKFRSMHLNADSDREQATRNDQRITKIGTFLRKTSLDEFPQFINVFLGNMSIVGPRPHMVVHTKMYSKRVNRFMLRHLVKPGITGMAQTHGYRGEIENDRDIINRFKYDLFYLENWSIFLDLKIIYLTVYNVFKGEEKAY
ncbi:exopolysaccharide biosynthesis polyprenyl glycosylphosphotransferase [Myroides sp. DF42-4-2]|uniref:exopolysaccharide biosynthesis polyprenyl glycosylphosphotransferase n=1 Tax=unclassified Myroides TaxID=2642485 RepID=UPI0025756E85|nr:exopolysaccharide biosynthesis polyprenyl glycosylphosphotransferase [Myroides sp. DF42-4-2]MDM1406866.1 exopolysaccharide biosynthesis polyprenyl glycosylphosphotransferase [Myroides sp. DF42-4-2]